jgi:excisionase family DNA binding protein
MLELPERLLTKDEVAKWLAVSRLTVQRWGTRGKLPRVMVDGVQYHRRDEVAAFIDDHRELRDG